MALEIFTGSHLPTLLENIRTALGPEACVVQLRRKGKVFELIASDEPTARANPAVRKTAEAITQDDNARWRPPVARDMPEFHQVLSQELQQRVPQSVALPESSLSTRPEFMARPWMVAIVGPTGAGKTTTIAKLATSPHGFAGCRVGLLGLDTYRVGAAEQLGTYAELAGLPCEIVYSTGELGPALKRLHDCEVVLIDTPGRGPRNVEDVELVQGWLRDIAADEVHLALPAGVLPAVSRRVLRAFAAYGCTHLLATKLDEHPGENAIFDLAVEHGLDMRWATDGQEVPLDLQVATRMLEDARARRHPAARAMERVA